MNRNYLKNALKATREPAAVISMLIGFIVVVLLAAGGMWWMTQRVAKNELPAPIVEPAPMTYVVQPGDSTWKLAERFYGDGMMYPHIELANSLAPDQELEVGQELRIPLAPDVPLAPEAPQEPISILEQATPSPESVLVLSSPTPQPESATGNATYVVQPGDSLWLIAIAKYGDGYKWVELYRANLEVVGANPDLIYPDAELIIPQL